MAPGRTTIVPHSSSVRRRRGMDFFRAECLPPPAVDGPAGPTEGSEGPAGGRAGWTTAGAVEIGPAGAAAGAAGRGDELVCVVGGQVVELGGRLEADGQTARLCVRSFASGDGGMPSVWPADVVSSYGAETAGSGSLRSENKRQVFLR